MAQAGFVWTMGSYIPEYLGDYSSARCSRSGRCASAAAVASSSDGAASEMAQFNPLFGVARAIDRRGYAAFVNPAEAIGLIEALEMHTSVAAAALGLGHDRGRLPPAARRRRRALDRHHRRLARGAGRGEPQTWFVAGRTAHDARQAGGVLPAA